MSADLLERARNAVTVEEECAVVFDSVLQSNLPKEQKRALLDIVDMCDLPRPVLLGVVAALKPEHLRLVCGENVQRSSEGKAWAELMVPDAFKPPVSEGVAGTLALSILIAILEASNAD